MCFIELFGIHLMKSLVTKSLLPFNATSFEKSLENAANFNINANLLKGFKFKKAPLIFKHLIWEYNLNDVIKYIKNNDNIISNGLIFSRTKGTKAAVKIALNWLGINDVEIYEEEPSVHFYEFQIGVRNRQFDFDMETINNIIDLAKPVRSKLSRVYNAYYDVRSFRLNESHFGDILSDNSGIKVDIKSENLTLSFGRKTDIYFENEHVNAVYESTRNHQIAICADKTYRLDFSILSQAEPDINNVKIEYQIQRFYKNDIAIYDKKRSIDAYQTFAKAAVVLSEGSKLGETNTCFSSKTEIENYKTFVLGSDCLSNHLWNFEDAEILERYKCEAEFNVDCSKLEFKISAIAVRSSCYFAKLINTVAALKNRKVFLSGFYETNPYWSEHKHSDKSWSYAGVITKIR